MSVMEPLLRVASTDPAHITILGTSIASLIGAGIVTHYNRKEMGYGLSAVSAFLFAGYVWASGITADVGADPEVEALLVSGITVIVLVGLLLTHHLLVRHIHKRSPHRIL